VSPDPFGWDAAGRVAQAVDRLGVDYVLGGSLASSLHGDPRMTNDIDFAARLLLRHVDPLLAMLGSDFSVDPDSLRDAIRRQASDNLIFMPTITKVDVFVRGAHPFDDSEFARRCRMVLPGGAEAWVSSPEDSILRKLMWFRLGDEVSERQWRDVLGMLRQGQGRLDDAYLDRWAPLLTVADLLQRARSSLA